MSMFDDPFDADRALSRSCNCGRHSSQAARDREAMAMRCEPVAAPASGDATYENVVASAVLRAMFPQDIARRAFL